MIRQRLFQKRQRQDRPGNQHSTPTPAARQRTTWWMILPIAPLWSSNHLAFLVILCYLGKRSSLRQPLSTPTAMSSGLLLSKENQGLTFLSLRRSFY